MNCFFRVLYSTHVRQKRKTRHDGFLKIEEARAMTLLSEDGDVLAKAIKPASTDLTETTRDLCLFVGYVVDVDAPCNPEEVPSSRKRESGQQCTTKKAKTSNFKPCILTTCQNRLPKQGLRKRTLLPPVARPVERRTDEEILECFRNPVQPNPTQLRSLESELVVKVKNEEPVRTGVCQKMKSPVILNTGSRQESLDEDFVKLECVLDGKKQKRSISIPTTFSSVQQFQKIWRQALNEEMQMKIDHLARRVHSLLYHGARQGQKHLSALKSSVLNYFCNCKLEAVQRPGSNQQDYFLTLMDEIPSYVKEILNFQDFWIVSSDPGFLFDWHGLGKRRIIDKLQGPWNMVFTSMWHQPSKERKLLLQPHSKNIPAGLLEKDQVYALNGTSLWMEIMMWKSLSEFPSISPGLHELLLHQKCVQACSKSLVTNFSNIVEEFSARFHLNEFQKEALEHVSYWLAGVEDCPPICLVHGPFGSGKSTLIIAMIHLLTTLDKRMRVLVCAHTNVAVDRMLLGLLHHGYTGFLRVGFSKKIAKPLSKHSIHSFESDETDSVAELRKKLRLQLSSTEQAKLRSELDQAVASQKQKLQELVKTVSVVGITCCSLECDALRDQLFDVVILDECSQIVEPLNLVPLYRSKARYLVAAGDPCQLPPLVTEPYARNEGLARTLFSRLQAMGHHPHFLKKQYRCHPVLCQVPNKHFYDGKLETGCPVEERKALISDWSPLCLMHMEGKVEINKTSRSRSNKTEAHAVITLLEQLMQYGLSTDQVGVICLFKSHVNLIRAGIAGKMTEEVQVSTVDSFQGMEKDVIILSMSVDQANVFTSDRHRLNVALTRARHHLIIVGNENILKSISPCVHDLVQLAQKIQSTTNEMPSQCN